MAVGKVTARWMFEDEAGRKYTIKNKNMLHIPSLSMIMACNQNWSQKENDNYPKIRGIWCATYKDECVLEWNQSKCKQTIPWDKRTNMGYFRLAPVTK